MNTPTIKKILVAIDFSESARAAFYAALDLAVKYDADTYVLHVSEPVRAFDFGKKYVDTIEAIERVEAGVQKRLDELWGTGGLEKVDRRRVHLVVRGGKADQEIIDTAKAKGADVIVMGASGAGGPVTTALGSTSERVVRHSPCSVLCIRSEVGDRRRSRRTSRRLLNACLKREPKLHSIL